MNRDELIKVAVGVLNDSPGVLIEDDTRTWIEQILDAVEPLIRADERERGAALNAALLRDLRIRLNAGVAALQTYPPVLFSGNARIAWAEACAEVLNLIDESGDT